MTKKRMSLQHKMEKLRPETIQHLKDLGIIKPRKLVAKHPHYVSNMKPEIRRLVKEQAKFECSVCGKLVKRAGMFEYRPKQMVTDYIPKLIKQVCRVCVYKLDFGSKGSMVRKRTNQAEVETPKYINLD